MATTKVTDLTALTSVADDDLVMIVDVSDTTGSAAGTSKKITKANLVGGGGGSSTSKTMLNGSFFDNAVRDVYLPVGNTETEYTSLQRSNKFCMPYAGQLLKVMIRNEFSAPTSGTLSLTLRRVNPANNTIQADIETITLTPTYAGTMQNVFTFTSTAALEAEKVYAFYLENNLNTALGNTMFTIVIEQ